MARLTGLRRLIFAGLMVTPVFCGSIEGTVTNAVTGEPVIDAHVRFMDPQRHVFTTATDSTGAYHLTGLDDGNYNGEFSKEGYSDVTAGSNVDLMLSGVGVARVSGSTAIRVDARLQPFGTLRGRVVDEDGKAASGVTVELSRSVDNTALTNADGAFAFAEMEPGTYTVAAKPLPVTKMREGERVGAVPVYYPSALELADAVPIRMTWGSDVAGIEIRLKSVPVHRVSGVVLDEAGKSVAHAAVRLLGRPGVREYLRGINAGPRNPPVRAPAGLPPQQVGTFLLSMLGSGGSEAGPGAEAEVAKMETGDDGAFAFDAVPPGDWRIAALTDEYGWMPRNGVVSAGVGDKDVEDVRVRVGPPLVVEVTADWNADGAQTAALQADSHPATSMVVLAPLEAQAGMFFDPSGPPPEIFPVLAGRYRVMGGNSPAAGYYVSSVTTRRERLRSAMCRRASTRSVQLA